MTRTTEQFTYQSAPHAAPARTLFSQSVPLTLMSDPRVIRGSTQVLAKKAAIARAQREEQENKHKQHMHEENEQTATKMSIHPPSTQPYYQYTVKPFAAPDLDVTKYLEAADDLEARKKDRGTEMDQLLERPLTPQYIPRKTGIDATTQVEDVTELFHFDTEVAPMLEIIVQKTLEQALLEVNAEEEIETLEYQAHVYIAEKAKEAEWNEEQTQKLRAEKEAMETQRKEILARKQKDSNLRVTIAGLSMMRQITPSMIDSIAEKQYASGAWKEGDMSVFERQVWPATIREVERNVESYYSAQQVMDDLLFSAEELYVRSTHTTDNDTNDTLLQPN